MPVKLEVSVSDAVPGSVYVPDIARLQQWADTACQSAKHVEASLQVVCSDEMQRLNREYRDSDKPTNVLSFPMELPEEIGLELLGDIAVCAEVIAAEADQQHKTLDAHWAHMIVHGMLHLQGYDHIQAHEAEQMEALEIDILNKLGVDNPYITDQ